jgi:AcrR family transcriptional regulator
VSEAPDRQVEKTRAALMSAFSQLHLSQGYSATTIRDVVKRANVGRSTFYEHFRSKDDILSACMARFFSVFAEGVGAEEIPAPMERVLMHLWDNRRLTDAIFTGQPRLALARVLSGMVEQRLLDMARANCAELLVPARLAAAHIAEGQLTLVEAWLRGKAAARPMAIGEALCRSATASASALLQREN